MNKILALGILCILALAAAALQATAASQKTAPPNKSIRVLLTTGGHAFQEKEFFAMWEMLARRGGLKVDKITLPAQMDRLKPGLEKQYDVIVLYDQMKNLTPEQQQNLAALIRGGIGVVSLHHNIGANTGWDEWGNILGALWIRKPRTIGGQQFIKSASADDQTFKIHAADPNHVITRGIQDFEIVDEAYDQYYLDPRVRVLLTTQHPKNAKSVAWVTTCGRSPIFYLQLGHDERAYNHPSFRRLLLRGIRWAQTESQAMRRETPRQNAK